MEGKISPANTKQGYITSSRPLAHTQVLLKRVFDNRTIKFRGCDLILHHLASGIVNAAKQVGVKVPLVVRLEGTNVDQGRKILATSGISIIAAEDLDDAAKKAVATLAAK